MAKKYSAFDLRLTIWHNKGLVSYIVCMATSCFSFKFCKRIRTFAANHAKLFFYFLHKNFFFLHNHFWKTPCKHSILHLWFNQEWWLKWPSMYPKNHGCITCINSFIAYHKNDLEILMVTTVCPVSKSNHRIERYRIIKFAQLTCIVSR